MDRRTFLTRSGGLATVTLLAGCGGDGGDGNGGDGDSGSDGTGDGTGDGGSDGGSEGGSDGVEGPADGGDGGGDGGDGGSTDGGGGDVKVGVLLPFSGDYAWVGANVLPVAESIVEEINGQGGIGGRDVSLVQGDTEGSPDASLSATQRLINVEGVSAIIGPTSITMSAVIDQFEENEVPIVTPTAGTTSLDTRGGEWVFRTVSSDSLGGQAIAVAASDQQYNSVADYSRMALMVGNEEVFQSFKEPIRSSFEDLGGTVTTAMDVRTGKSSYQSEVQSMMNSDPELCVLLMSVEDSVKITEAGFQAGYEGTWFATQDQTNEEFLAQSENQVTNGMFGLTAAPYGAAEEAGRLEAFRSRMADYADWEESKIFDTNTYDATNVLGLAMKRTAADGDDVTGATIATNVPTVAKPPEQTVTDYTEGASAIENGADVDYEGLVGPINFDENGDIVAPFSIKRAQDGAWTEAARLPPEALS
jgi:neutral amino acid transport system substrate-binding protein